MSGSELALRTRIQGLILPGVAWALHPPPRPGIPDLLVCRHGHVALLELKRARTTRERLDVKVTQEQLNHLIVWAEAGGKAGLVIETPNQLYVLDPRKVGLPLTRQQLQTAVARGERGFVRWLEG